MLKKILGIVFLVSGFWGLVASASAQTESITFTTYYPSPYGVYKNLRIYPNDDNTPGDPCTGKEGEMYFDRSDQALCICSGSPPTWVPIGGTGGGGWWTQAGSSLYPNNLNWNVGIGTATPGARLQISENSLINLFSRALYAQAPTPATLNTAAFVNSQATGGAGGSGLAGIGLGGMDIGGSIFGNIQANIFYNGAGGGQPSDRLNLILNGMGGNVGIGRTSPTQKLDVNGKVKVSDSVIYPPRAGSPPPGIDPTASTGEVAYYTTPDAFYHYNGLKWVAQAGGGGGCYTNWDSNVCAAGYTRTIDGHWGIVGWNGISGQYGPGATMICTAKASRQTAWLGSIFIFASADLCAQCCK